MKKSPTDNDPIDVYAHVDQLLARHRSIAAIWCIDDVKGIRPDLTDDQAGEVLQEVEAAGRGQSLSGRRFLDVVKSIAPIKIRFRILIGAVFVSPPRVSDADAVEQAAAMVDRFHKIMTLTLRTLHDLRRRAPVVMVQNASQVNVAQQQFNVSD